MRIYHNISALNAWRNLYSTDNKLSKSMERLSSGLRINRAADDAAGLAISEKMRGQIRGLNQATWNAQEGISFLQTAEGALNESHRILQRMRELSVQAANDALTTRDRMDIQEEIDQLKTELNRIANTTEFNTKKLLDGSTATLASTSDLDTRVYVRGGLGIDGQNTGADGNYKLQIEANPGVGQVQKTNIFKANQVLERSLEDEHMGTAHMRFEFANVSSGSRLQLKLEFKGQETFAFQVEGDNHTEIRNGIADYIANHDRLSELFQTDVYGDRIRIFTFVPGDFKLTVLDHDLGSNGRFSYLENTLSGTRHDLIQNNILLQESVEAVSRDKTISDLNTTDPANFLGGEYLIKGFRHGSSPENAKVVYHREYSQRGETLIGPGNVAISDGGNVDVNHSIAMLVDSIDGNNITFSVDYSGVDRGGDLSSGTTEIALQAGIANQTFTIDGVEYEVSLTQARNMSRGDRIVFNTAATILDSSTFGVNTPYSIVMEKDDEVVGQFITDGIEFLRNNNLEMPFFQLDTSTGEVAESNVDATFAAFSHNWHMEDRMDPRQPLPLAGFTIKEEKLPVAIAASDSKLRGINGFYDTSGNFLLEDPQTISIMQGDGKRTSFTIFADDTVQDIVDKLNEAIGKGLDQAQVAGEGNFVSYVKDATEIEGKINQEAVEGTLLIRSARAGQDGELSFLGNEEIIKALGLTTIEEAEENEFQVRIKDAHSDREISNTRTSGNLLRGEVHESIDVRFNTMAGVDVTWNEAGKRFEFNSGEAYETTIHLSDNTIRFHLGANPLQNVAASIGDMGAEALGVHNLLVINKEVVSSSINAIDRAIERVSSERGKLGALQNRLEHTINNLQVAAENLTAAESRIRDVDMSAEMMEFTRNQILMQTGTAMLAQANMRPQSVLQLLG